MIMTRGMRKGTMFSLSLMLISVFHVKATMEHVNVKTNLGEIRGYRENVFGKDLDIFLGIPFATPPVEDLRFKRPRPVRKWAGIKDATQFPNACYQVVDTAFNQFEGVDMWNPNTPVSEDCLYLNIWTPSASGTGKAVMVWIYGGSFTGGSSSLDVYDGRILAQQGDVVVVSLNYRLGALGFLYDGTDDIPGNMGLLDQTMALQWINNHIAHFGGDNRRVTVFGESAGAASTSLLTLSPLSQNFITSTILLSGSAINKWATDPPSKALTKLDSFASLMGCDSRDNDSSVVDCLMEADAALLSEKTWYITDNSRVPTPIVPVVDNHFLHDTPLNLFLSGKVSTRPVMLGSVENEGTYFMLYQEEYSEYFKLNNNEISKEDYVNLISAIIGNQSPALSQLVDFIYTQPEHFSPNPSEATTQDYIESIDAMLTDKAFICGILRYAELKHRAGSPVYTYFYEHRTSANPWPEWMGVMHGYEIDHFFGATLNDSRNFRDEEKLLSEKIIKYITNFAKSGNPNENSEGIKTSEVEWLPYSSNSKDYIVFQSNNINIQQGLREKYCRFWTDVFPSLQSELSDGYYVPEVTAAGDSLVHTQRIYKLLCIVTLLFYFF